MPSNEILGRIVISQALASALTLILAFFLYRSFLPVSLALGASLLTACAAGGFARHPTVLRAFVVGKPVAFWSWGIVQGDRDIFVYPVLETPYHGISFFRMTRDLSRLLHWVVVCLATAAGILIWLPQWSRSLQMESLMVPRLIAVLLFYFTLLHAVGLPCPRYAVRLRPLVFGMAFLFPFLAGKLISRKHPIDRFADESAV